MKLPEHLRPYFWNCRFEELDSQKNKKVIIEQIMEYGNLEAWRWMMKRYKEEDMIQSFKSARQLSPHSRSFWALFLHLDLSDEPAPRNTTWQHRYDPEKSQ